MDRPDRVRLAPDTVPHPGVIVLDYLDFHGWSQRDLSRRTGVSPKTISEICNQKTSISPQTAIAFERAFQRPAHLWLNLQRQFDEAQARRDEVARLSGWDDWARRFPLKEMERLRFSLPQGQSQSDVLLSFFGVASPESWETVWRASGVAYRQTLTATDKEEAVAAWVREVELVARGLGTAPFDETRLLALVDDLRRLTRSAADEVMMEEVQGLCASAGVAVVWVPALKSTGISGCARWLSDRRAVVGLTLRYKTDDQMWFTLLHEIGHLVLHRKKHSFVLDNAEDDLSVGIVDPEMQKYEEEANRFAADTLIPPSSLTGFLREGSFTNESIHQFAERIGVGPGIVVGRLQHDGFLKHHQGNSLKQRLSWGFLEEN